MSKKSPHTSRLPWTRAELGDQESCPQAPPRETVTFHTPPQAPWPPICSLSPTPSSLLAALPHRKVAVVTGAGSRVGFAVVRALCRQYSGDVILTARDSIKGQRAVADLIMEGLTPTFHQLDVTDEKSITKLTYFLQINYGGLDIVVHTASIWPEMRERQASRECAEETLRTNYWGSRNVLLALLPLLKPHARVVNVSSVLSLSVLLGCSASLRHRLTDLDNMDVQDVDDVMSEFLHGTERGSWVDQGWPDTPHLAYSVSKVGVTLLSFVLHRQLASDTRSGLVVLSCCTGSVCDSQSCSTGRRSIEEGARTAVNCAFLPAGRLHPHGKVHYERKLVTWRDGMALSTELERQLFPACNHSPRRDAAD